MSLAYEKNLIVWNFFIDERMCRAGLLRLVIVKECGIDVHLLFASFHQLLTIESTESLDTEVETVFRLSLL